MSAKLFSILFLVFVCCSLDLKAQVYNVSVLDSYIKSYDCHCEDSNLNVKKSLRLDARINSFVGKSLKGIDLILEANCITSLHDSTTIEAFTLYKEGLQALDKQEPELQIWANINYGFYLYTYRDLDGSIPYLVKAISLAEENNLLPIPQAADSYKKIAYTLFTIGDYPRSILFMERALKFAKDGTQTKGDILGVLGATYLKLNNANKAKDYLELAIEEAKRNGDVVREAKSYGTLAQIYISEEDFKKAEEYLNLDRKLSVLSTNLQNKMYAGYQLAKFYISQNRLKEAEILIQDLKIIGKKKNYLRSNLLKLAKLEVQLASLLERDHYELTTRVYVDSLETVIGDVEGEAAVSKLGLEIQRQLLEYGLVQERLKREQFEDLSRNKMIVVSLVLLVIMLLWIYSIRSAQLKKVKYENIVSNLQLDKLSSELRFNEVTHSLASYKEYLNEKNHQYEKLQEKLQNVNSSRLSPIEKKEGKLEELLQSHLVSEPRWQEFKKVFIEEEAEYYHYLVNNFSGLTESNLRILFLKKLKYNNPQMAHILGITVEAVKKQNQRMRKKYGEEYDQFLDKLSAHND